MYTIIVCFLFTSFIFFVIGNITVSFLEKEDSFKYSFFDNFFIGLCTIGCCLNVWSIFLPTNIYAFITFLILAVFFTFKNKKKYWLLLKNCFNNLRQNRVLTIVMLIVLVITIFFSIIIPRNYDSYLYHINAIQWIENYRVIPGLANLHNRFGLNSSLFVLSAAFSFTAIFNQYFFIINSLSYLIFTLWIVKEIFTKKGITGLFLLLFLYYFALQYGADISSPGTDLLPNIVISFVLLNLIIDKKRLIHKYLVFVFLSFFCLTLKLSTLPIIFIGLIAIFYHFKNKIIVLKYICFFAIFIIAPWLIRNIILTGYIIYPLEKIDLFNFDWKVTAASIDDIAKSIYTFAKIPVENADTVSKMSFKTWSKIWWQNSLLKNQYFYILALVSPTLMVLYCFLFRKANNKILVFTYLTALSGILFWFFTAPDIRFAFAFLLITALIPIFIFEPIIAFIEKVFNPLLIISMFYTFYLIFSDSYILFTNDYKSISEISNYAYLPKDIYYNKFYLGVKFTRHNIFSPTGKKFIVFEPERIGSQCYDQFPCTWIFNQNIVMRGENFQNGFKNK